MRDDFVPAFWCAFEKTQEYREPGGKHMLPLDKKTDRRDFRRVMLALAAFMVLIAGIGFLTADEVSKSWTEANCPDDPAGMAELMKGTKPTNWNRFKETHSNVPVWAFRSVDVRGNLTLTETVKFEMPFGVFEYAYHAAPPTLADGLSENSQITSAQGTWYCVKTR